MAIQSCTRISAGLRGTSILPVYIVSSTWPLKQLQPSSIRRWSSAPVKHNLVNAWINTRPAPVSKPKCFTRQFRTSTAFYSEDKQNPKQAVTIRIVDYSDKDIARHEVQQHISLEAFLQDNPKPERATRWVYVNGISTDDGVSHQVLHSLGKAYKLHQLALEDVIESRGPTKADWYDGHLFIAMPLHKLLSPMALEEEVLEDHHESRRIAQHRTFQHRDWRTITHRKFNVSVEQASIFLTNTGTVVTVFQKSGEEVFEQMLGRLDTENSVLRSNDPSMLVQAVIDVAVDLCMPIEKAFADEFSQIESTVLSNPAIQQSRSLYILRSRLTLLLDNFIAINSLLKKLCGEHLLSSQSMPFRQDRAAVDDSTMFSARAGGTSHTAQSIKLSQTTQIYLRDVLDHVHTLSASTEVAIRSTENLTSLIFNTIAASQNESVRQLTVISSFFLPLTFLTGYMGMNFESMPVVQQHSDLVFWAIAAPAMVAMGLFMRARALRKKISSHAWAAARAKIATK